MRIRMALLMAAATLLLIPASALASLQAEQAQGRTLAAQIRAGTKTCADLSAEDLDHIGEYAMFRALGSTRLHQAMNDRMTRMLGQAGETRMHERLGRRYVGCATSGQAGAYGMMGGGYGMMGGGYLGGRWSTMMDSGIWGPMMNGGWRTMTRGDWQRFEQRLFGQAGEGDNGWSPLAIVGATLGGVILAGAAALLVVRRLRHPPTGAAPS